eukprot:CAMPEP_0194312812 /NCGR_PEP_ID=MMETSP0171-20130528/9746_1 /TAXON_ID=218684 /ORGANISM="Corethron pennatum, Strain L29A3" /LENGTH=524 /DNA_ID=CAMNT_0039067509 /DNA_START=216 /DNA_END=1790 /DNA_ORIENTATION=-
MADNSIEKKAEVHVSLDSTSQAKFTIPDKSIQTATIADNSIEKKPEAYVSLNSTNKAKFAIPDESKQTEDLNLGIGGDEYDYRFIKYEDVAKKFPLPDWWDKFLKTQPVASHDKTLSDPDTKFLVMTCHKYATTTQEVCGGITDRLVLLPHYLWLAHKTGRKFFIRYSKPAPLEEFFVPPKNGFDWRLPDGYIDDEWKAYASRSASTYKDGRRINWAKDIFSAPWNEKRVVFVNSNLAMGAIINTVSTMVSLNTDDIWPGLFRRMFQPSKNLAQDMASLVEEYDLKAGEYASAHVRVKWPKQYNGILLNNKESGDKQGGGVNMSWNVTYATVTGLGDNAIKCAVRAMPWTKYVYFASDANELTEYLLLDSPMWSDRSSDSAPISWNGGDANSNDHFDVPAWEVSTTAKVIARPHYNVEPEHFDKNQMDPKKIYATFIDMWMMAHAKYHSFGVGGYGHFGTVLSGNHGNETYRTRHRDYDAIQPNCATSAERKKYKAKQSTSLEEILEIVRETNKKIVKFQQLHA